MQVIHEQSGRSDAVWFIDPPYTASKKRAGTRLYTFFELDHPRLFELVESLSGDFLMTYDNAEEILELAHRHAFDTEVVAMTNTHHATMSELLIGRDLGWARDRASRFPLYAQSPRSGPRLLEPRKRLSE